MLKSIVLLSLFFANPYMNDVEVSEVETSEVETSESETSEQISSEEVTSEEVVEDEDSKTEEFFETAWGKIMSYVASIGLGGVVSVAITILHELITKRRKEEDQNKVEQNTENLKLLIDKAFKLINLLIETKADNEKDREALTELTDGIKEYMNGVNETLESQSSDIEKINVLSQKFDTLMAILSKMVSTDSKYVSNGVAEAINELIGK